MGEIVELLTSNDGNIRTAKDLLSTKNWFNCPLNLLYPLECEHEHRQMSREIPMIEQTDPNIKKNRGNKKLPVISSNERISNDKDDSKFNSQRTTKKAAWETKDRIIGQNLTDNWAIFGGRNVANMREFLFCLRNETLPEQYF